MFKLERNGRFPNWHLNAEPSSTSEAGTAEWLSPSVTRNPLLAGGVAALHLEGLRSAMPLAGAPVHKWHRRSQRLARFVGRAAEPKKR